MKRLKVGLLALFASSSALAAPALTYYAPDQNKALYELASGQGCCSWHGGINYCDRNSGREVCNDGTYSPSCRC